MRNAILATRLMAHVLVAVFKLSIMMPRWSAERRRAEIAAWARKVFALLGVRLVVHDAPRFHKAGMLYAGNHVSWLDIFAMLATVDVRFVAKAEVRDWPVMGWLATRLGTHFIRRDSNCEAYAGAQAVSGFLAAGENVCIFPEGSTTDGARLQPFRTALFEAATKSAACVQPFAIRYRDASGYRSQAAAFIGDMSLIESVRRLLQARDVTCDLVLLDPIDPKGLGRRQLARATELQIAERLNVDIRKPVVTPAAPMIDTAGDFAVA